MTPTPYVAAWDHLTSADIDTAVICIYTYIPRLRIAYLRRCQKCVRLSQVCYKRLSDSRIRIPNSQTLPEEHAPHTYSALPTQLYARSYDRIPCIHIIIRLWCRIRFRCRSCVSAWHPASEVPSGAGDLLFCCCSFPYHRLPGYYYSPDLLCRFLGCFLLCRRFCL